MSIWSGRMPRGFDEVGLSVASYSSYEDAQKAVAKLVRADVPSRDIAVVGTGLRSIERITGKLTYLTAARSGLLNGLLFAALFSAVVLIGNPEPPLQIFLGLALVGVALGMMLSLVSYWIVRRKRDYASMTQVVAETYEITVSEDYAHHARGVLGTAFIKRPEKEEIDLTVPPRYGERLPVEQPPTDS